MKLELVVSTPRCVRRLRNVWRRVFPPKALRVPGKFPWARPNPLPFGFTLVETPDYKVVSDGKGGTLTLLRRLPPPCPPTWRASRRGTR